MGHDGRKRRSHGSSDDEGKLGEDGFCNEDLRVGGPELCSIPLLRTPVDGLDPVSSLLMRHSSNGQDIGTRIFYILHHQGIWESSDWVRGEAIEICLQQSIFHPESQPIPTIVITVIRQKINDHWLQAAREIYRLLCEENHAFVSVEINDPEAFNPPFTSLIHPNDEIYSTWDPLLAKILESIGLEGILSIGCYRRRRSPETSENTPTILVMVDVHTRKSWKATRDMIARLLTDFSLPMVEWRL
ncbi:hypothetical protein N7454_003833 [Penicillium verhagenii]|nr:hypothetical protein N7454_003833 [Penicillium verhagenii]